MTCIHLIPGNHIHSVSVGGAVDVHADMCSLLMPDRDPLRENRRLMLAEGFKMVPIPYACPLAQSGEWAKCPLPRAAADAEPPSP